MDEIARNDGGPALIGITGGVAAAAGLVIGLLPVAAVDGGTCGSPFAPASRGGGADNALVLGWCADSLGARQGWAWALLIAGVVAIAAAVVWHIKRQPANQASASGELERLANLHKAGALTDSEYQAAKSRLLGQGSCQGALSTEQPQDQSA